ncbi:MAG: metallophosphoesterase [Chloroflexota bacterium]
MATGRRWGWLRTALATLGVVLALGLGVAAYAFLVEPRRVVVDHVVVTLPCLPPSFSGLRVVQLSDLHLGEGNGLEITRAAITQTLALRPDVVVLTGDYVSTLANGEAALLREELSRLAAPLGVYAVLGNHDRWSSGTRVSAAVRAAGVTLLHNESVALRRGEEALYLVGVDDPWVGQADLPAALADVPAAGCTVLLAHEPDWADEVALVNRVALQLSGHTHGGQARLPFVPRILPPLGHRYPEGLNRAGDLQVYTNRGLGTVIVAARFNCPPEVTLLELRPPR